MSLYDKLASEDEEEEQQQISINTTPYYHSSSTTLLEHHQPISSSTYQHQNSDIGENNSQQKNNEKQRAKNTTRGKKSKKYSSCLPRSLTTCFGLGDYIKSVLFGGLDGICTVFVCVATIIILSTGHVPMIYVLIIGIAKLLSGAISMGIGDFMSSKAEVDLIKLERKRELWECENFIRGEMDEMADIYVEKGLKKETALRIVELMSKNKKAFVDVMMVQELGLVADYDSWYPLKSGLINFSSFMLFGSIPLLIYVVTTIVDSVGKQNVNKLDQNGIFYIDVGITLFTLIVMGGIKSKFSSQHFLVSVLFTIVVGIIAAGSGYLVAWLLAVTLGIRE